MSASPNPAKSLNKTASATISTRPTVLRGFYVNSTTTGTIQFFDSVDNSGTPITGIITPSIGWNSLGDIATSVAAFAQIGGSALNVTLVYWE